MTEPDNIVELIERVLSGDPWHGSSVAQILAGVTPEAAAKRPSMALTASGSWCCT